MTDASSLPSDSRLASVLRTTATLARRLMKGIALLTGGSAGAGTALWVLLRWPPQPHLLWLASATVLFVVLLAPATILGLFYVGLRDLQALPNQLSEQTRRTLERSTDAARMLGTDSSTGLLGRLWGVMRQIWALRSVLLENRVLLLRYGALIRFVNPGFLLLVVLSTIASLLLIPAAAGTGLVLLFW